MKIEDRMIENGISKEKLLEFARLPIHNEKEDIFRDIIGANSLRDLSSYSDGKFLTAMSEVLMEIGVMDFPNLSPENNQPRLKYLGEERYKFSVAQMIAIEMLGTLRNLAHEQYDETLGLNKIYQETLEATK
ncbi:MAG TPA: hypothetical protein VJZ93_01430 [Candidatus Nanoarchaeia archaeon]|nr:hypothetical protein [Candidatus Nanoarchaeia archaeon]